MEIPLVNTMSREMVLWQYYSTVYDRFGYTIIDCMPPLSMLIINTLTVAAYVIIPTQADYPLARGLERTPKWGKRPR